MVLVIGGPEVRLRRFAVTFVVAVAALVAVGSHSPVAGAATSESTTHQNANPSRIAGRMLRQQRPALVRPQRHIERRATPRIVPEVAGIFITAPPDPAATPTIPTPLAERRPPDPVRLQDALDRWTKAHGEVGAMTVSLRVNGATWTGSATAGAMGIPDPAATYRVLSITKTMTAALIMREVEAGRLTLDGPLPVLVGVDAPLPAGLTVRLLLRHQSGFVDYAATPGFRSDEAITPTRAVELTLRAGLTSPPGMTTSYNNSNYLYLGLLLEQIEGHPFAELVNSMVGPLGLVSTHVDPPNRVGWAGFSSGGVMSTVSDIATWGDALLTPGRVLRQTSLDEMMRFGGGRTGLGLWGYCPCTAQSAPDRFMAVGHHTAAGGMFVFPKDGVVLVMHAEVADGDTADRARSLAEEMRRSLPGA